MNRRDAIARIMAITGTMAIGADFFLTGCARPEAAKRTSAPTADELALLDEVGETIIPATDTPGAKAVKIGAFMATMSRDCYDDATYSIFRDGIGKVDAASRKKYGKSFVACSATDRTALLNEIEREQRTYTEAKKRTDPVHYFRLMKELTLIGYFSSEIGCTQALRYAESPGRYDGNAPYAKGDRAWYNPSRRLS